MKTLASGSAARRLRPVAFFAVSAALLAACGAEHDNGYPGAATALAAMPGDQVEMPPPPFGDGMFPCSECHDPAIPANRTRRPMRVAHEEIALQHDEPRLWCYDCHTAGNHDKLHLADGTLIDFAESHRLCAQCHGEQHRNWRAGVHGRRSGQWNGEKTYLLCAHCHSAHAPAFRPLQPAPPPIAPARLRAGSPR